VPGNTLSGALPPQTAWWVGYAVSDYKSAGGSCYGDDGIMHKWSEAPGNHPWKDVIDGLSNTLLVGESSYVNTNPQRPDVTRDWPVWIGGLGEDEQVRTNGRTSAPINCGCTRMNWMKWLSDDCNFSMHSGGAQFVFCDGSVHFLSENIAIQTYCDLHSIRDGKALGQWE
jgi:prepilin-type processing-associated H-X9-DG protein